MSNSARTEVVRGIKDGIPVLLGYLPLGFAFGVMALQSGLRPLEAVAMSALAFTGAGQYIAIGILAAGGMAITILTINLLVNLRYVLFSAAMAPKLKSISSLKAGLLMLGLTDETYAVCMSRTGSLPVNGWYLLGLNVTAYFSWVFSTAGGVLFGNLLTHTDRFGLNFALPAMYTILLVLVASGRKPAIVAGLSAVLTLICAVLFPASLANMSCILVAAVAAATLGVILPDAH